MWDELGIDPTDDQKAIRRAYAARLRKLDPDYDVQAFTRLRVALERALAGVAHAPVPKAHASLATDASEDLSDVLDLPSAAEPGGLAAGDARMESALPSGAASIVPDWVADAAADQALLDELDHAFMSCDAPSAVKLYHRAAATGAVPLGGGSRLLERVLSLAVDDKTIDDADFLAFVRAFGCDQSNFWSVQSETHKRVMARLVATDWYEARLAVADRRKGETRKQARLARLILGRIGRYWMPRVDRGALRSSLDEYHIHEKLLSYRIDPAWIATLEARLRRREIAGAGSLILLLGGLLINGIVQLALEVVSGASLRDSLLAAALISLGLGWIVKIQVKRLLHLVKPPPAVSNQPPPDDQEARLRWLEQQAELAYEAMYDAPAGSALAARYSDAKEFLFDAIALARRLGQAEAVERLSKRLDEIKMVFRTQFPG